MNTEKGHPYFTLRDAKSTIETGIFLMMQASDGRLKYATGEKVLPVCWEGQRCTGKYKQVNNVLNRMHLKCEELRRQKQTQGIGYTKADLRREMDTLMGRSVKIEGSDFFNAVDQLISERESGKELTDQGKVFSPKTISGYRHTKDYLLKYETARKMTLSFAGITMGTYHDIIRYLNETHDHSINNIGKHIKNFGVFLRATQKRGWHNNPVADDEEFVIPSELTPDIYLTEEELEAMAKVKLSGGMLVARDWFFIEAYTGLRVSDAMRLGKQNLSATRITISNEKTDEKVVIPVHRVLQEIFKRNKGVPPFLAQQTCNEYIKEVAKLAGITTRVLYTITKGGRRVDTYFEKWQMVSHHTGRRSLITNLLRAGVSETVIMKLTGIKKSSTLQRYNKLSSEETADVAAELAFFK